MAQTYLGGAHNNEGTVFKITPAGQLTTLHSFRATDGYYPIGGLIQGTNGVFYGTASEGGPGGDGTIFALSTGLGPFVETVPDSGKAGSRIISSGEQSEGHNQRHLQRPSGGVRGPVRHRNPG
jgi:uncharacterized repeat protein (TIGR03803 family)